MHVSLMVCGYLAAQCLAVGPGNVDGVRHVEAPQTFERAITVPATRIFETFADPLRRVSPKDIPSPPRTPLSHDDNSPERSLAALNCEMALQRDCGQQPPIRVIASDLQHLAPEGLRCVDACFLHLDQIERHLRESKCAGLPDAHCPGATSIEKIGLALLNYYPSDIARPLARIAIGADRFPRSPFTVKRSDAHVAKGEIVIKTAERRLLYYFEDSTALEFPVAVGRRNLQRLGQTRVVLKRLNPTWVPTGLQHRVYRNLPRSVGPGPANPLGTRALNLTIPNIRIHGTNDDTMIGEAKSDGCFRMFNEDIEFLFDIVTVGTKVTILR